MNRKNRKGLSGVVETVLMIALVIAVIAIVWAVVNGLVKSQLNTSSCFNILDKVSLNSRYTCYNESDNTLHFSVSIGDIDNVQDILVSVTKSGQSASFKIKAENPAGLYYLNGTKPANMSIPEKNSGLTYKYNMSGPVTQFPDSVEIAPIISGQQCQASTPIQQIDSCSTLVP